MNNPQLYYCKNEEGIYHKFFAFNDADALQKIKDLYDPHNRHTWKWGRVADLVYTETLDCI
jgi:hypothetical protein